MLEPSCSQLPLSSACLCVLTAFGFWLIWLESDCFFVFFYIFCLSIFSLDIEVWTVLLHFTFKAFNRIFNDNWIGWDYMNLQDIMQHQILCCSNNTWCMMMILLYSLVVLGVERRFNAALHQSFTIYSNNPSNLILHFHRGFFCSDNIYNWNMLRSFIDIEDF